MTKRLDEKRDKVQLDFIKSIISNLQVDTQIKLKLLGKIEELKEEFTK